MYINTKGLKEVRGLHHQNLTTPCAPRYVEERLNLFIPRPAGQPLGSPLAKTLCSQCRGPRFDPWLGN